MLRSYPSFCLPDVLEAHHLEFPNLVCVKVQTIEHVNACVPIVVNTFNMAGPVGVYVLQLDVEDDRHPTCKGKSKQCN